MGTNQRQLGWVMSVLLLSSCCCSPVLSLNAINTTNGLPVTRLNASLLVVLANQTAGLAQRTGAVAWQRADTPAPAATSIAATPLDVTAALRNCSTLTVDVPLLRTLGSNFTAPRAATFWLFDDATGAVNVSKPFNASRAAAVRVFAPHPTEGNWTVPGATGGLTVDEGAPTKRFHVESYRFRLDNVTLVGGRRYWLALAIEMERALNISDMSANQPRWLVADSSVSIAAAAGNSSATTRPPFRMVDRYGTQFFATAAMPAGNWTAATNVTALAQVGAVVPANAGSPLPATPPQLALVAYASACYNSTPVQVVSALPPQATRHSVFAANSPVPSPSPSPTPSPSPSPSRSPTPTATSTPASSPVGPTPTPVVAVVVNATPHVVVPSPTPTPMVQAGTPLADAVVATPTPAAGPWWTQPTAVWPVVICSGLCLVALVLIALYVAARRFRPDVTGLTYEQVMRQEGGGGEPDMIPLDDSNSIALAELPASGNTGIVLERRSPTDDGGSDSGELRGVDLERAERDEARDQFDRATMRAVPLGSPH